LSTPEFILAGGKWDTFRMLTHPGSAEAIGDLMNCSRL
jgi:hypothetical protein